MDTEFILGSELSTDDNQKEKCRQCQRNSIWASIECLRCLCNDEDCKDEDYFIPKVK